MRRPENQQNVVGTLLGSVEGSRIDILTSFAVPIQSVEDKVVFDSEYATKMLHFQRKVNRKETLIGFYKTGMNIDDQFFLIYDYYQKQLTEQKNKSALPKPIILLIDPTMNDNRLSIKVSSLSFCLSL